MQRQPLGQLPIWAIALAEMPDRVAPQGVRQAQRQRDRRAVGVELHRAVRAGKPADSLEGRRAAIGLPGAEPVALEPVIRNR